MNTKEYEFAVDFYLTEGTFYVSAENIEEAYNKATATIQEALKDLPIEVDFDVECVDEPEEEDEEEEETCVYCGKEIILDNNEYEIIDGDFFCSKCVKKHFGKCEWCQKYVPLLDLAHYGSILCCDDCATERWIEMEEVLGKGDD